MSKHPFTLVPWQSDFIATILDIALKESDLGDALFIFPHSRPARYLERAIQEDKRVKKPCLMPECLTGSQLFQAIWNETHSPAQPVGTLDRVGLLLECLRAEQAEHPGLISRIPSNDTKAFFPWGRRLSNLFEECLSHRRVPESFMHLEDELMPFAAAILSRLGSLYKRYLSALEAGGWTTPGFTASRALDAMAQGQNPRALSQNKHIYICGYASLNGTEDELFKHLWQKRGARVLVHADPAMAEGKEHWSCAAIAEWRRAWGAGLDLMPAPKTDGPKMNFYAGYDLHSQLAFLRRGIHKRSEELGRDLEDTAVILPDTSLLLPVLHHIQPSSSTVDVNISMGYPLSNTALQRFLDSILALHKNYRNGYYWKDCIHLLRQPYMKMLDEHSDANGRSPWRELLLKAEHRLRDGRRYVNFAEEMEKCLTELDAGEYLEKVRTLWESVRLVCMDSWQGLSTLQELASALERLVDLLLERGEDIWPRFPIDAECLSRFAHSLVPELKNSAMAKEALPQDTIFAILRELAEAERVPFDAYPLTVLQIMGLLESRLLSFKSVFILDATDNLLPGGIQNDPLVPDSLRQELGLPDSARRQHLMAYYFFRLLQSAQDVHIFWQEGVEPQGLLESKKLRSRFVEELLWREEQSRGYLLKPNKAVPASAPEHPPLLSDGPLFQIGSRLAPFTLEHREIIVGKEAEARLKQVLMSGISATQLNSYMRCPAAFYYRNLAGLKPARTVIEKEDPPSVGNLFHQVLKDYHAAQLGKLIKNEAMHRGELVRIFNEAIKNNTFIDDMPPDARIMLNIAGERKLKSYLNNQPDETTIKALELPVSAPLSAMDGTTFRLHGTIDRIDERIQPDGLTGHVILDYKTGKIKDILPALWNNDELWQRLENDEADFTDQEFFCQIADYVPDVQLPFYLYLASFGQANSGESFGSVCNAALVNLRDKGEEKFIFPDELLRERRTEIIEDKISLLLDYFLRHLASAKRFFPRPGNSCEYCDYQNICIVLSRK